MVFFRVGLGWDMAKWDMQKEVSQAGQTSFCAGSGELRRPLHCGRSAEAARNSACLSLFISIHLLTLSLLPSPCSSLTTEASGTRDYPRCHPHTVSIHCADLPTIRDRSQPRNEHSATHSHLCTTSLPTSTRPPSPSLHTFWSSPVTLLCHWECPLIE